MLTPAFTEFLHSYLDSHQYTAGNAPELFVGDVVRAALETGMNVQGVQVPEQHIVDIGTADDLSRDSGCKVSAIKQK